jgi:hypothetical protein
MGTGPEDVLTGDRRSVKESTSDIGHLDPAPVCAIGAGIGARVTPWFKCTDRPSAPLVSEARTEGTLDHTFFFVQLSRDVFAD